MATELRVQRSDSSLPWFWQSQPAATAAGEKLFEDYKNSIFKIENGLTTGTGWIGPDGRLVTAYHVIKGATELTAVSQDGRRYKLGGKVSIDDIADLAALEFVGAKPDAPRIPVADDAKMATTVRTLGHPLGLPLYLSEGTLVRRTTIAENAALTGIGAPEKKFSSQLDSADYKDFVTSAVIVSEIPCNKGNSGGPLFDHKNRAISICSMGKNSMLVAPAPERFSNFLSTAPADEKFVNSGGYVNGFSAYLTALKRQPLTTTIETALAGFSAYGINRIRPKSSVLIRSCASVLAAPYIAGQTYFDITAFAGSTTKLDSIKYGLASVADSAMVAGLAGATLSRNPKILMASKILAAVGAAGRLSTQLIPNNYVLDVHRTNGDTRAPFLDHLIWFPLSSGPVDRAAPSNSKMKFTVDAKSSLETAFLKSVKSDHPLLTDEQFSQFRIADKTAKYDQMRKAFTR